MGRDLDEYLVHLRENASEIRNLGKEWGMTEEEINACVEEALASSTRKKPVNVKQLRNSPKNTGRRLWGWFLFLLKLPIYIILACIALYVASMVVFTLHPPAERYVGRLLHPHAYAIQRVIRLASLPLHRFLGISKMYESECLIDNPFFEDMVVECDVCSSIKRVKDVNASEFPSAKFSAYVNVDKPIVFRKGLARNVTYTDLRRIYQESDGTLDDGTYQFVSTEPEIRSAHDLFDQDREELLNTSNTFQVKWETRSVWPSVFLRRLFPRPSFMPDKVEIMLTKHIQLDAPNTPSYELPRPQESPKQIYVLGSGKRRVLIRPQTHCASDCNALLVVMEAGDMLMVSRAVWHVFVGANGDEPSVDYLFTINV